MEREEREEKRKRKRSSKREERVTKLADLGFRSFDFRSSPAPSLERDLTFDVKECKMGRNTAKESYYSLECVRGKSMRVAEKKERKPKN